MECINLIASFLEMPCSLDFFLYSFMIKVPTKTIKSSLKKFLNIFCEDRKMMRNLAGILIYKIIEFVNNKYKQIGHLKYWKIKKMKLSDNQEMFMDTLLRGTIAKISQVFFTFLI